MLRKWLALTLCLVTVGCFTYSYLTAAGQIRLADQLLRFHVVANSDTVRDQQEKLRVRDALLPRIEALTEACENREQAEAALAPHLEELSRLAEQTLSGLGDPREVRVFLTTEAFPRRDYDTFSLPAGTYRALRVVIGRGEGQNWWCVAFPGLCLPATVQEVDAVAADAGLSEREQALLTERTPQVELKFRTLEWLQALRRWIEK